MFCTKCGMQNEEGTKFCVGCGSQLEEAQEQEIPVVEEAFGEEAPVEEAVYYAPDEKKGGLKKIIIAAVAVIVVAVIGFFGFKLLAGGSDKDNRAVIFRKGSEIWVVQNGKTKAVEFGDDVTNLTATADGKYIYYVEDNDLFYAPSNNPDKAVKIVGGIDDYTVSKRGLRYEKGEKTYFSANIKKEGEKLYSDAASAYSDKNFKNLVILDTDGEMYTISVSNPDKKKDISKDVTSVVYQWDEENGVYVDPSSMHYIVTEVNEEKGTSKTKLMYFNGKDEKEVEEDVISAYYIGETLFYVVEVEKEDGPSEYDIKKANKAKGEKIEEGDGFDSVNLYNRLATNYNDKGEATYSFITSAGKVFEIDVEIKNAYETRVEDDKYFYNVEYNDEGVATLVRYEIKANSFGKEEEIIDNYSDYWYSENGDLYLVTREDDDVTLHYYNGKKTVEICEDFEDIEFDGDTAYYVSDGELYKGSKKAGKKLADDVYTFTLREGSCYYIADYKDGEGTLYKVGSKKAIEDDVTGFYN